jgi:hypothetical protein
LRSGGSQFKVSPGQYFIRPCLEKIPPQKRAGGVVECLPRKCEALSSTPSTGRRIWKTEKCKKKKMQICNCQGLGEERCRITGRHRLSFW